MNSELIMKSDVLDILFENKNKEYGAYSLRKYYGNRLYKALGIMCVIVVVFAAYSFIPAKETPPDLASREIITGHVSNPEKEKEKEKPKEVQADKVKPQQRNATFEIVPNNVPVDTIHTLKENVDFGLKDIPADTTGGGVVAGPGNGPGGKVDTTAAEPEKVPVFDPEVIVDNPDVYPSYPGGPEAFKRFLQKHLVNPKDMEEGESVKVVVKFVVGHEGKLKSFDIVQDGGDEFNREVLRVLKKMPAWNPGRSKGRDVSVYYSIPVKFVPSE